MVTQQTIALLIAKSLEAQGIAVKTNLKGNCLRVMLESSQVPNRSAMVAFIRRGMMKLGTASIKSVKVYGKQAEASTSAWSQDIDLEDAIALSCPSTNPVSQIASSKQKSTKRHRPRQFMPFTFKVLYRTLTPNTSRQVGSRSDWLHHRV